MHNLNQIAPDGGPSAESSRRAFSSFFAPDKGEGYAGSPGTKAKSSLRKRDGFGGLMPISPTELSSLNNFYGEVGNHNASYSLHESIIKGEKNVLDHANTNDEINALSEELFDALNDEDQIIGKPNAEEIFKKAKRKANQNISLTTVGLKRKAKNSDGLNIKNQNFTIPLNMNQVLNLPPKREYADVQIYHIEKNVAIDGSINRAIRQSNELIRIANLSYYHQSKSEFVLC